MVSMLTGVCHGNRLRVNVTESPAERGKSDECDGSHRADQEGVEDRRLLVRGPADVPQGSGPELRGRHGEGPDPTSTGGSGGVFRDGKRLNEPKADG
jgi:hypothetical protein